MDEIDEVGNLGYDILKPVLDRASPKTLMHIEDCNHYLMEETFEVRVELILEISCMH